MHNLLPGIPGIVQRVSIKAIVNLLLFVGRTSKWTLQMIFTLNKIENTIIFPSLSYVVKQGIISFY